MAIAAVTAPACVLIINYSPVLAARRAGKLLPLWPTLEHEPLCHVLSVAGQTWHVVIHQFGDLQGDSSGTTESIVLVGCSKLTPEWLWLVHWDWWCHSEGSKDTLLSTRICILCHTLDLDFQIWWTKITINIYYEVNEWICYQRYMFHQNRFKGECLG